LLGLATSINEKIHRDESVLERFFHQSRTPRPSKADVINVCAELRTALPTLPEAGWLANALEHYLEGKHDQDPVGGNLSDYLANDQLRANVIKAEVEELQPIVEIGKNNSGGHKLKDLLFPRVSDVSGKPFRTYGDQLMKVFSVLDLNWQVDGHPIPAASNLKARTDGIVEGAVPLSWFSDFITDKDWLKDLAAHFQCHSNCAPLKVAVVQTRSPEHVCVMFWHSGNGFCDEATLSACAAKMLQVAVEFSHIFIASTCENGTRALVELLPEGNVRRIPACKVSFGETCFDFSEWENGSAYLFAVPGSV
jgi:hypothetical protein